MRFAITHPNRPDLEYLDALAADAEIQVYIASHLQWRPPPGNKSAHNILNSFFL